MPDRVDDLMSDITYEAARAELREVVAKLESGGQSLEESLALWERGEVLADVCQKWLDQASARLDQSIAAHDASTADTD
jgi:exodeoxyribonuclease VII small subunit